MLRTGPIRDTNSMVWNTTKENKERKTNVVVQKEKCRDLSKEKFSLTFAHKYKGLGDKDSTIGTIHEQTVNLLIHYIWKRK